MIWIWMDMDMNMDMGEGGEDNRSFPASISEGFWLSPHVKGVICNMGIVVKHPRSWLHVTQALNAMILLLFITDIRIPTPGIYCFATFIDVPVVFLSTGLTFRPNTFCHGAWLCEINIVYTNNHAPAFATGLCIFVSWIKCDHFPPMT